MITIEKEIEKYISDVSSKLLCSKEKKKELIEDIRGAVFDFAEGSGTKDIAEIYKHFGTPEELAKAHLSELDPKQIKKKVDIRRVVIAAVAIIVAVLVIAITIELIDSHKSGVGFFSEEVVTKANAVAYINIIKEGFYL